MVSIRKLVPLCQNKVDTVVHLLINCKVLQEVWDKCDRWVKLSLVRHNIIINHFQNFHIIERNKDQNLV